MPDNHLRQGIAFKLIFRVLLFCAVTGLLTSAYIFISSRNMALESLDQKLRALAISSARQIDSQMRNIEDFSRATASALALFHPGDAQTGQLLEERVRQVPEVTGLATGLEPNAFGSQTSTRCVTAQREGGRIRVESLSFDYFSREWYQLARGGGGWTSPYVSAVRDAAGKSPTVVSYGAPVTAAGGGFLGAVCADLDMDVLERLADSAKLMGDCYIFLVDRRTRRFIVHPNAEVVREGRMFDALPADANADERKLADEFREGREGSGLVRDLQSGELRRIYFLPLRRCNWTLGVVYDEAQILHGINTLMVQTLVIAALSFGALLLLVRHSARRIIEPLLKLERSAQDIACGKLTTRLPVIVEQNEVGRLCDSVRTMTQGLIGLVRGIKQSTVRLVSASAQIAATSAQQEKAMNGFESEVASVAAAVAEISASARELAGTMQTVNEAAESVAAQAGDGKQSLQALETTMRTLNNATMSMAGKLELIRQSVENISGIVGTIAEVAEQTNLLSLNASIEAEKAGEYGKGFSVVAREIRRLSDKTSVATIEIGQVAGGMQTAVEAGVAELELFTETVSRCAGDAAGIGDGLGGVITQVTGLSPSFVRVNDGMQAQARGATEISDAMLRLRAGAEGAAESMNQLNSATEQLREAANLLREETTRFQTE